MNLSTDHTNYVNYTNVIELQDSDTETVFTEPTESHKDIKIKYNKEFGYCLDQSLKLYKQKFSKIKDLLSFTVENRGISKSHIVELYEYYKSNPNAFISPIHILAYLNTSNANEDERFYIADGQHRVEALKLLLKEGVDFEILYFLHDVSTELEIRTWIKKLNSTRPVEITFTFEKSADLIKKLKLCKPLLFSSNENHRSDKINEIRLNNLFHEIKFFNKIDLTAEEIFTHLLQFNTKCKNDFLNKSKKAPKDKKIFDRIAATHQFYCLLHLEYSWVHAFYNYLINDCTF
jgi:hypothetical protein